MEEEYRNLVNIGKITTTQGRKGEVRVLPLTHNPHRFDDLQGAYLTSGDIKFGVSIQSVRYHKGSVILKFQGFDCIDQSGKLVGMMIAVDRNQTIELPEDHYFIHDIIGLKVKDEKGVFLGKVEDIIQLESNDIYVIKGAEGEILIPATKEVVLDVDLENEIMAVHLMEGLL